MLSYRYVWVCVFVCLSVSVCCQSGLSRSFCPPFQCLFMCLRLRLCACLCLCQSVSLLVCLYVCLSACLCLSVCLCHSVPLPISYLTWCTVFGSWRIKKPCMLDWGCEVSPKRNRHWCHSKWQEYDKNITNCKLPEYCSQKKTKASSIKKALLINLKQWGRVKAKSFRYSLLSHFVHLILSPIFNIVWMVHPDNRSVLVVA